MTGRHSLQLTFSESLSSLSAAHQPTFLLLLQRASEHCLRHVPDDVHRLVTRTRSRWVRDIRRCQSNQTLIILSVSLSCASTLGRPVSSSRGHPHGASLLAEETKRSLREFGSSTENAPLRLHSLPVHKCRRAPINQLHRIQARCNRLITHRSANASGTHAPPFLLHGSNTLVHAVVLLTVDGFGVVVEVAAIFLTFVS